MVASMTSTKDQGPRGASAPLTLTARSPEDLLALAPVVLGFLPADSVVMLTFGASEPFHARLDLPGPGHGVGEVAEVVDLLITPARQHGVQRVVLLIYSADRGLVQQVWQGLRCGFDEAGIVDAPGPASQRLPFWGFFPPPLTTKPILNDILRSNTTSFCFYFHR